MTRLRTTVGIEAEEYEKQYLLPFGPLDDALERFRQYGYALTMEGGRCRLTPEGFLMSNTIISDLLLAQEECEALGKRV
jgi:coproporphyrinogen III oxidase-like Fe-S oxidoreductase